MSVEDVSSRPQKINPESYFQGFVRSDVQVVADMASYIVRTNQQINTVIFQRLDQEQKNEAIVYVEEVTRQGPVWTELNWSAPGLPPQDYDHTSGFYNFTGAYEIQLKRTKLLAEVLQKPFSEIDVIPKNAFQIPSLGIIVLNNPFRPNPLNPKPFNTGSHLNRE